MFGVCCAHRTYSGGFGPCRSWCFHECAIRLQTDVTCAHFSLHPCSHRFRRFALHSRYFCACRRPLGEGLGASRRRIVSCHGHVAAHGVAVGGSQDVRLAAAAGACRRLRCCARDLPHAAALRRPRPTPARAFVPGAPVPVSSDGQQHLRDGCSAAVQCIGRAPALRAAAALRAHAAHH